MDGGPDVLWSQVDPARIERISKLAAMKWERIEDGYRSGDYEIGDNGGGLGPAKGGRRWAVMFQGKWLVNIDTLSEAKQYAEDHSSGEKTAAEQCPGSGQPAKLDRTPHGRGQTGGHCQTCGRGVQVNATGNARAHKPGTAEQHRKDIALFEDLKKRYPGSDAHYDPQIQHHREWAEKLGGRSRQPRNFLVRPLMPDGQPMKPYTTQKQNWSGAAEVAREMARVRSRNIGPEHGRIEIRHKRTNDRWVFEADDEHPQGAKLVEGEEPEYDDPRYTSKVAAEPCTMRRYDDEGKLIKMPTETMPMSGTRRGRRGRCPECQKVVDLDSDGYTMLHDRDGQTKEAAPGRWGTQLPEDTFCPQCGPHGVPNVCASPKGHAKSWYHWCSDHGRSPDPWGRKTHETDVFHAHKVNDTFHCDQCGEDHPVQEMSSAEFRKKFNPTQPYPIPGADETDRLVAWDESDADSRSDARAYPEPWGKFLQGVRDNGIEHPVHVSVDEVVNGHHRVWAAGVTGKPVRYVDHGSWVSPPPEWYDNHDHPMHNARVAQDEGATAPAATDPGTPSTPTSSTCSTCGGAASCPTCTGAGCGSCGQTGQCWNCFGWGYLVGGRPPNSFYRHRKRKRRHRRRADHDEYDWRGNSHDRHARKQFLLKKFGDGFKAPCYWCGVGLSALTLQADRLHPGRANNKAGDPGGRYNHENLVPSCGRCNTLRNTHPEMKPFPGRELAAGRVTVEREVTAGDMRDAATMARNYYVDRGWSNVELGLTSLLDSNRFAVELSADPPEVDPAPDPVEAGVLAGRI